MTKIEKVIKDVSGLHQFYAKIQKRALQRTVSPPTAASTPVADFGR